MEPVNTEMRRIGNWYVIVYTAWKKILDDKWWYEDNASHTGYKKTTDYLQ